LKLNENTPREQVAAAEDSGARLDRWMAGMWDDLSRSRCKALVEQGCLSVDGEALTDPSAKSARRGCVSP